MLIETPLGQSIPATLLLQNTGKGFSGKVKSEMGNGELLSMTFDGESFAGAITFDVAGQTMEAQIAGELSGGQMEGNVTLENAPPLPFTGNKA